MLIINLQTHFQPNKHKVNLSLCLKDLLYTILLRWRRRIGVYFKSRMNYSVSLEAYIKLSCLHQSYPPNWISTRWMSIHPSTYLSTYLPTYLPTNLSTYLPTYLPTYQPMTLNLIIVHRWYLMLLHQFYHHFEMIVLFTFFTSRRSQKHSLYFIKRNKVQRMHI